MKYELPPDFTIDVKRVDSWTYQLRTSQTVAISPDDAFVFFQDPFNLFEITPDWLDFRMKQCEKKQGFMKGRSMNIR